MNNEPPQPTAEYAPDEDEAYVPPRFWWLKRLLLAAVVLIVVIVTIHTIANYRAKARLQRVIEGYQAAGIPIYPEDFNKPTDIPDDENAVTLYKEAAVAFVWPSNVNQTYAINDFLDARFAAEHLDAAALLVNTNGEALSLIREATGRKAVDWGVKWTRPMQNTVIDSIQMAWNNCKLLEAAARYHAYSGNEAATIETLLDATVLVNRLQLTGCEYGHVSFLVTSGRLARMIEDVSPRLALTESTEGDSATRTHKFSGQLRDLIRELLNESNVATSWKNGILSTRAMSLDMFRFLIDGNTAAFGPWAPPAPANGLKIRMAKPLWYNDMAGILSAYDPMVEAGTVLDFRQSQEKIARATITTSAWQEMAGFPADWLFTRYDGTLIRQFRSLAKRRLAATALAIKLFEVDHGMRPSCLGDLVPRYLTAVPHDPLASDGRAIQYAPDATTPILYSVDVDGVDDRGAGRKVVSRNPVLEKGDLVFFLNGNRPQPE